LSKKKLKDGNAKSREMLYNHTFLEEKLDS